MSFIPWYASRNLDEMCKYNKLALMSLRSRFHVKAFMVLTIADHLFIRNYIRSLLHIILRPILRPIVMVRTMVEPTVYCCCACISQLSYTGSKCIYILIYKLLINDGYIYTIYTIV